MTDSEQIDQAASAARPGKRERLIAAACELVYRQGVARTTLADIAQTADVPVGNVYYYFKTKDDIIAAILQARAEELAGGLAALEHRHRSPKARLQALVRLLGERRDAIAQYGCRFGTLSLELTKGLKETDPHAAPLVRIPLDWAEQQFSAMGRRDAHELAVELVVSYHGSAVLSSTLGQPELMARQTRRLERWIETVDAVDA
ncbi:TetR/AcrR family transcriptional regulator [Flindersiella endophytica]